MVPNITVQELYDRLRGMDRVLILDVRAQEAFDEWHIDHPNAQVVNIQTSKLIKEGPEAYLEIPKDREVVTVCAQGVASMEAAEILRDHGYEAVSLAGGMRAWSEFYYPVPVVEGEELALIQVIRPGKGCLSYVLVSGQEAVVVDPGRHTVVYQAVAERYGASIRHVLDTHCHADHISGGPGLAAETQACYWISAEEMEGRGRVPYEALTDGLRFRFGRSTLEVVSIPTPGHTPGSVSFLVNQTYLLSGDAVFVSGLGRPDLGGKALEWSKLLYETVSTKLANLSGDVWVLPAHYSSASEINDQGYVGASLEEIRRHNDLLQDIGPEEFTSAVVSRIGKTPPNYDTIVRINLGLEPVTPELASTLEIGPNRCAAKHLA